MPILITELNLNISVNQPGPANAVSANTPEADKKNSEKLVDECVEQIVKIIRDKKER